MTLAARPSTTPSQTPQQQPPPQQAPPPQGLPPGFPGALPAATPPAIPGFNLPQPTNSGSLDLSAIKPVNSGSVSIQDALAKARGYAAQKGLSSYEGRPRKSWAQRRYHKRPRKLLTLQKSRMTATHA